ncbi:MAG: PAQR family membrane homeostasis protein TrhA, partial [Flavobacteriaceae bacterium]
TYTPVSMSLLQETSGALLLILVWSLALIGIIYKLFFIGKFKRLSLMLYLAMGWLVVLDYENVMQVFSQPALHYLILGGVFFSVGTIFYSWKSWYYHHVVWHLWVLAGAFAHFQMVRIILENNM